MPTRLEVLEQMVARGGNDPFPYYGLALEYRSQGRDEDALRTFGEMRTKFPGYVPQYLMAGQIYERLGQREMAREWFEAGIVAARAARDAHALGELEGALAGVQ